MDIRIVGLGTANPPLKVTQREAYDTYVALVPMSEKTRSLLEKILVQNQSIATRHVGMNTLAECVLENSQDQLIARYKRYALPTALEAARKALAQANLEPEAIDSIVVNTCTGYLCPGMTSFIAEALPLRKDVRPFDIQGMGCGGALPGLETAYNYLQARPNSNVLAVAVEICTATIVFSEEPGIIVSNSIFGDGAAATILTNRAGHDGLLVRSFGAGLFPEYRQHLQYITENSKLKNVLSQRVPTLGAKCGKQVVDNLLADLSLAYDDVAHWVVHTGGEKVIDAFQRGLNLPDEAMVPARTVLQNYGNMSSASVLFVLEETLRTRQPQAQELLMLCSFGAGFTAFAALLEQQ